MRVRERERRKYMLFGGVYSVYGIRSLFRGHSPGGATLVSFVTLSPGPRVGGRDEVVVGLGCEGKGKGNSS